MMSVALGRLPMRWKQRAESRVCRGPAAALPADEAGGRAGCASPPPPAHIQLRPQVPRFALIGQRKAMLHANGLRLYSNSHGNPHSAGIRGGEWWTPHAISRTVGEEWVLGNGEPPLG